MLTIDGSTGEGGGQVLRTALSLAAMLGQPVQISNIRAGRKQPGLRPQHVQSVKAAAAICNARLEGVQEHSRELRFEPQTPPQPGVYVFDIGTAGAATLVLLADRPRWSCAAARTWPGAHHAIMSNKSTCPRWRLWASTARWSWCAGASTPGAAARFERPLNPSPLHWPVSDRASRHPRHMLWPVSDRASRHPRHMLWPVSDRASPRHGRNRAVS